MPTGRPCPDLVTCLDTAKTVLPRYSPALRHWLLSHLLRHWPDCVSCQLTKILTWRPEPARESTANWPVLSTETLPRLCRTSQFQPLPRLCHVPRSCPDAEIAPCRFQQALRPSLRPLVMKRGNLPWPFGNLNFPLGVVLKCLGSCDFSHCLLKHGRNLTRYPEIQTRPMSTSWPHDIRRPGNAPAAAPAKWEKRNLDFRH